MWKSGYIFLILLGCWGKTFTQKLTVDSARVRIAPVLINQKSILKVTVLVSDSAAFLSWAKQTQPNLVIKKVRGKYFSVSNLNPNSLRDLRGAWGIQFIDRGDRVAKEETVLGDFDLSLNTVTSAHNFFPSLTGEGLAVSIKEKPFDQSDLDLRGRIILNNQFDEPFTLHATIMATIAAGGGNTSPAGRGVAWGAGITTSDFSQLLPDNGTNLTALGVSVQNHSYGVGIENYYGTESGEYDFAGIAFPKILHVFSSGNEGDKPAAPGQYQNITDYANLTGQFKVSKNTLSVGSTDRLGNVVPRSSRGPAHDGRVKPELTAFGDAGSSEAAAIVSGIALLVQQSYKNMFGELPDVALVKAAMINSAIDTGRPQVDFETGFGNVNALGAIRTIENENFYSGSVAQNEENSFIVNIPSNTSSLKITLVWNDQPAIPFATKALVNDLDFVVRKVSSGESWQPWILNSSPSISALQQAAQRGADHLNNVEQVTISFPAEGDYEIKVNGFDVPEGLQIFFVAYEMTSGFEWIYPLQKDALKSNTTNIIRWRWNNIPTVGSLEYRFVSENSWNSISTGVALLQSYFEWNAPDTSALIQFRIISGGETFESDTIPVSHPYRLQVGFNCENEVMLAWNKIPTADEYVLYSLGEKYLEPFLTTPDTFAIIQKTQASSNYFSIAPRLGTREGLREFTIDYTLQGTGCYFISFLPEKYLVTDDAAFNVTLGTTYKLQSATLERLVNGTFETVQTITPLSQKNFTMTDESPIPGIQTYRVKLTTDLLSSIYSSEVEIFYVRNQDLFVYPNPVFQGQELNIVVNDEDVASIQLFDMHGGVVRQARDSGPTKTIDTTDLVGGTYLLRVQRQDGRIFIKRLIVL